jgi:phosphoserine aminotransferase
VASSEDKTFTYIPEIPAFDPEADFVHITYNNTIYGTQFHEIPDTKGIPLFADISSGVLSKPLDISKFDLLYGGAQKNLGPAGMALVIVKDSLLERIPEGLPTYLDYRTHVKNKSLFQHPTLLGHLHLWPGPRMDPKARRPRKAFPGQRRKSGPTL